MAVTSKTSKMIWGQFAATCAICRKHLIHEEQGGVTSLIGEVAHIVGESSEAARGKSDLTYTERNDRENLLLLCREHHKIIDDNEIKYSIEYLNIIKSDHLRWINTKLVKSQPFIIKFSAITYINVPRLSEYATLVGFNVDLSRYDPNKALHELRYELNHVIGSFQRTLANMDIVSTPLSNIKFPHEGYVGALVRFDSHLFRTRNIPGPNNPTYKNISFAGDARKDPHIYCTLEYWKLVLNIDPRWITTSTAFTLFKPTSGQSIFSGCARITHVDYESSTMMGSPLVIGLPQNDLWDAISSGNPPRSLIADAGSASPPAARPDSLSALVDLEEGRQRGITWLGDLTDCDLCGRSFALEKYMIDGGVKQMRAWACMCQRCFQTRGRGLGWGVGQLYLKYDEGWLLVSGFPPRSAEEELL